MFGCSGFIARIQQSPSPEQSSSSSMSLLHNIRGRFTGVGMTLHIKSEALKGDVLKRDIWKWDFALKLALDMSIITAFSKAITPKAPSRRHLALQNPVSRCPGLRYSGLGLPQHRVWVHQNRVIPCSCSGNCYCFLQRRTISGTFRLLRLMLLKVSFSWVSQHILASEQQKPI